MQTETAKDRFEKFILPEPNSGCWLWDGSTNGRGYGSFCLHGRSGGAHRASYQLYKGAIPAGLLVLHKCDVPPCVNPDHLFLGTHADNTADMVKKGRARWGRRGQRGCVSGENNGRAKLTTADVLVIRSSSETNMDLARQFGVHNAQISRIRHHHRWAVR